MSRSDGEREAKLYHNAVPSNACTVRVRASSFGEILIHGGQSRIASLISFCGKSFLNISNFNKFNDERACALTSYDLETCIALAIHECSAYSLIAFSVTIMVSAIICVIFSEKQTA